MTLFYTYLMTGGKNVYTSMIVQEQYHCDIFPHNITVPRDIEIVPKARLGEGEELNNETFAALLLHAKREGDEYAETVNKQNDKLVFSGKKTVKNSKATEGCNPSIRETKKKVTLPERPPLHDLSSGNFCRIN